MRPISSEFAAALASDATTLCHCWRLTRHDGGVFGFTDHDRDLSLGGTVFLARSGLDASDAQASVGLAIGGSEVQGALEAQSLTEADLANGLLDDASVEIWRVDWTDTRRAVLMDVATIGEVRRTEFSFVAELRSLAHRFDEQRGRTFQRACSADLGDARCKVDVASPALSTAGTVITGQGASAVLVALDAEFPAGFFIGGMFRVTAGAASGTRTVVRSHGKTAAGALIVGETGTLGSLASGDRIALTAGCDKSPETCRAKFDNLANFRGFPHMPGNDVLLSTPNRQGAAAMDGGSLFS